jgi:D-serine deaminase-like pyridoxal phosphate-dependent protein
VESWYRLREPEGVATPALLLYRERLERNIRRAIEIAGEPSRLWPHVKTHKCGRIVRQMRSAGIERFKCATVAEAHMLGRAGAAEVLVAYPLVGENARRYARLFRAHPGTSFATIVDGVPGIEHLARAMREAGERSTVYVDLDVGMHRTGASERDALDLYRRIAGSAELRTGGLHLYDGHNHEPDLAGRQAVAQGCREQALRVRDAILSAGHTVERMIAGGTPSFPCYAVYPEMDLSPGTCFLHDAGYGRRFPDLPFEPAALLLSSVVSRPRPGSLTLDCGHKAIAADPPGERGVALNLRDARTLTQSEEHWLLACADDRDHDVGSAVYILPTHVCPTFALHREVLVVDGQGRVVDRWVIARDR